MQERATLEVANDTTPETVGQIVSALHAEKGLTVTLMLRALVRGHLPFFEAAMSELSGVPLKRVQGLLGDRTGDGFRSVYRKTKLPADGAGALWAALDVLFDMAPIDTEREQITAGRRMVERVLTRYETVCGGEVDAFYALLARLAADEAREEVRSRSGGYFRAA